MAQQPRPTSFAEVQGPPRLRSESVLPGAVEEEALIPALHQERLAGLEVVARLMQPLVSVALEIRQPRFHRKETTGATDSSMACGGPAVAAAQVPSDRMPSATNPVMEAREHCFLASHIAVVEEVLRLRQDCKAQAEPEVEALVLVQAALVPWLEP